MDRKEFLDRLAEGRIPSVLLFEGEDAWLMHSAVDALRKKLLPEGMEELNETELDAPETDALIAAAETLPFMADRRLVLLRDYPALTGRSETDDRLAAYLPQVPDTAVVLFLCMQKPDARKKLYGIIKKLGGIVSFPQLKGRELTTFVTAAFRERGKECDERTAEHLIFLCGADAARLLTEIDKIASLRPEEKHVQPGDVQALAVPTMESKVFQMVDAVVSGQDARAFMLLRSQLMNGESRIGILAMLLRQFRMMQHIKIMQYEKKRESEILAALGLSSYIGGQYLRQAAGWNNRQVRQAVKTCLDTDYRIKAGELNQEGALEALILQLLSLRKKQ